MAFFNEVIQPFYKTLYFNIDNNNSSVYEEKILWFDTFDRCGKEEIPEFTFAIDNFQSLGSLRRMILRLKTCDKLRKQPQTTFLGPKKSCFGGQEWFETNSMGVWSKDSTQFRTSIEFIHYLLFNWPSHLAWLWSRCCKSSFFQSQSGCCSSERELWLPHLKRL